MEQKLSCAVVKDLLPNYIEHLTSETTNLEIEEHLSTCLDCTTTYEEMKTEIPSENLMKEAKDLSKFLRKTKAITALKVSCMAMMVLAIIICVIVDLAINQSLTWSIIVIASLTMTLCTFALLLWGGKHNFIKAFLCLSAFVIPLQYVIAIFCRSYGLDTSWFMTLSVPISLLWLAIFWIGILSYQLFKHNFWFSMGITTFLCLFGNLFTDALAEQVSVMEQLKNLDTLINTICFLSTSILLFIIAYIRREKRI